MKTLWRWGLVLGTLGGFGLGGCGDDSEQPSGADGSGASAGGSSSSNQSGGGGSQGSNTGANSGGFNPMGSGGGSGGVLTCGGTANTAEPIPLDIYLMLDKSGSMTESAAGGVTKWEAVTDALGAFFVDPDSVGIAVGLQFFPIPPPTLPASCTDNQQCGANGPCVFKTCTGSPGIIPCENPGDCGGGSQCIPLGHCSSEPDPDLFCAPAGGYCNGPGDPCVPITSSFCALPDSCNVADYTNPAVEIAVLDGATGPLDTAIAGTAPSGATPTAPAISGAIAHAQAWATANPTHTVVAVLATDGLPTECSPLDIGSIASIAAAGVSGSPSVPTYVIGVFNATNTGALMNLNQIAQAGGTNAAFVIDPAQNVEEQFLDAMNAIRGAKLACEYLVPPPEPGETQDFAKVNVEFTPPGATQPTTIGYVGGVANCDPAQGGWYYDVDPAAGVPTKITMCPATCTLFAQGGTIDIRVGCETVVQPPPG